MPLKDFKGFAGGNQINSCNTRDRSGTQKKPREGFLQPDSGQIIRPFVQRYLTFILACYRLGELGVLQLLTKVTGESEQLR